MFRILCFSFALVVPELAPAVEHPLRDLIEQYEADENSLMAHYAADGDTNEGLLRRLKLHDSWLARIKELDFKDLSLQDQVDAILLRNEVESATARINDELAERKELRGWDVTHDVIETMMDARVRGDAVNPEQAALNLDQMANALDRLEKDYREIAKEKRPETKTPDNPSPPSAAADHRGGDGKKGVPTPYQAKRVAHQLTQDAELLKGWFENYERYSPEFGWWVKQPYEETKKALESYARFFREDIAGIKGKEDEDPLLGRAIGAEALRRHLDEEFIPYSPEELIALAEREMAWCEDQMRLASQEMHLGDDWKEALRRVKAQHVKPGEQEALVRTEARRATNFVKDHHLVTVPPDCEEWWGTHMISGEGQRTIPYAAYGGGDIMVAYASGDMKYEDKEMSMRGNNIAFTRNVVPHELIPGHHLQNYMAARHLPYRRLFFTPFFVEGWALYWEMRLYGLKYQHTPEDRLGALFWRMHRCARIIVTLKSHLGQMTPPEMVNFLVERVGHEKFGAISEVRRFITASPLYQCGYMLGGLQLLALHKELVTSGKMTELQFHDEILKLGPIPVELIRASLTAQPLTWDFKTQWRFDH